MYGQRGKILDCRCPIDWSHPLNRGLVSEWAGVPLSGWIGSNKLRDLARGGKNPNDGTLTGMAFPPSSTSGWQGTRGRVGGYGCLAFDGSNDYVDCGTVSSAALSQVTLAAWMYRSSSSNPMYAGWTTVSPNRLMLEWKNDGNFYGTTDDGVVSNYPFFSNSATGWHHFVLVFNGSLAQTSRVAVYYDGVSQSLTQGGGGNPTVTHQSGSFTIGVNTSASLFGNGAADDVTLINRALSSTEVAVLYAESKTGNPNRWRWLRGIAYSAPATVTFQPLADLVVAPGCNQALLTSAGVCGVAL